VHPPTLLPADGAGVTTTFRLLLVEDDDGDAFLVRELLQEAGAPVVVQRARTLHDAVHRDGPRPDCVLLDLGLPDASGLDALHGLLMGLPGAAVIVLTGLADEHRAVEAVAAGAQDYLVKGAVDGALLARAVRYAVERKRADAELRRLSERELQAAENARLERGLLPQPEVRDPGLHVVSRYRPGRDALLGGDFFDVVERPDGRVLALVGDVCGHGPDEAALGVALRIAWRTLVLAGVDDDRLLPVLEDVLVRERRNDELFATVAMVCVDETRTTALLWLAGHPAPLLLGPPAAQLPDEVVGPALGVLPGVTWGRREVALEGDWRLLLFSDGLVEGYASPDRGDRLDVEGLLRLLDEAGAGTSSTGAVLDAVVSRAEELNGEPLQDDVAVLVLERRS
jgi:serine phosphatase RsbU (regulator of sigma subunit)